MWNEGSLCFSILHTNSGTTDLVDSLAILRWEGTAEEEKGIEKATGQVRVEVDPKYYRPTEVVSVGSLGSFPGPLLAAWNVRGS